jgi:hypothetical protein
MAYLKKKGFKVAIVEKWNQWAKVRQDLFGIFDLLAIHPDITGVVGIQVTSGSNMAARRSKIAGSEMAPVWLLGGNTIELHGWRKVGERGKRKVWDVRVEGVIANG